MVVFGNRWAPVAFEAVSRFRESRIVAAGQRTNAPTRTRAAAGVSSNTQRNVGAEHDTDGL